MNGVKLWLEGRIPGSYQTRVTILIWQNEGGVPDRGQVTHPSTHFTQAMTVL